MEGIFKKALERYDEKVNAVPIRINLPLEQYLLLTRLEEILNQHKPENVSLDEIISCIVTSWEAMKASLNEVGVGPSVMIEFGKLHEQNIPPDELRIFLKEQYSSLLRDELDYREKYEEEKGKYIELSNSLIVDSAY